jgi:REP element-mobilizing transposase RayT
MDSPEYPGRLNHSVPGWVSSGSPFHIRIRTEFGEGHPLISPHITPRLLDSVRQYHDCGRWWCDLFIVMPDHVHAILSFPQEPGMAATIRNWKRATARLHGIQWQSNFFDHRIRHDIEMSETWSYLENNPVVKGLAPSPEQWPWRWSPND